uniref:Uncharacterized protein n=1 Tax=Alexandrium monilatum TaxID=311494 RepID=A0A7S4SMV8_9DINO
MAARSAFYGGGADDHSSLRPQARGWDRDWNGTQAVPSQGLAAGEPEAAAPVADALAPAAAGQPAGGESGPASAASAGRPARPREDSAAWPQRALAGLRALLWRLLSGSSARSAMPEPCAEVAVSPSFPVLLHRKEAALSEAAVPSPCRPRVFVFRPRSARPEQARVPPASSSHCAEHRSSGRMLAERGPAPGSKRRRLSFDGEEAGDEEAADAVAWGPPTAPGQARRRRRLRIPEGDGQLVFE